MVSNYNTLSNVSIMLHGVTRPYKYSFPVRALSRGSNKHGENIEVQDLYVHYKI